MKKSILLISVIFMMTGFMSRILAQAIENTAAAANIITPISLTETSSLHFGTMSVLALTGGTCILSTQGIRTTGGAGGVNLSASAPTATNAAYNVGGSPNVTYAITLPALITVTEGGGATMDINGLLARPLSAGADQLTGTLSGGGTDSFTIGGTLNVNAAQTGGLYSGTFNVTVAYN
jgi:hypothetical protein